MIIKWALSACANVSLFSLEKEKKTERLKKTMKQGKNPVVLYKRVKGVFLPALCYCRGL